MVDSLLTKNPVRYSFYDENVGSLAKDGIFAARLRTAREQRELNQTELAKLTGLQPAAIGHFEANRRKPSFANIRALAKALEVSSDYLLGRADTIRGATTAFRNEESLNQLMIDTLARRREDREK